MYKNNNMVEFFKHFFGLCGDGHPSVLTLLGATPFLVIFWDKIKLAFGFFKLSLKNFLKRL